MSATRPAAQYAAPTAGTEYVHATGIRGGGTCMATAISPERTYGTQINRGWLE